MFPWNYIPQRLRNVLQRDAVSIGYLGSPDNQLTVAAQKSSATSLDLLVLHQAVAVS